MTEFPQLERDQGRIIGILEQMNERLTSLEARQQQDTAAIRQEMAAFAQHLDRRLDSQFRWIVGIQFGMVGLLVTILLKVL